MGTLAAEQIERICMIAHETSINGRGLSLLDAIQRSGYSAIRGQITQADVAEHVATNLRLVEYWLAYSEDKRTTGWYFVREGDSWGVGYIARDGNRRDAESFRTVEEACARFILAELDRASEEHHSKGPRS